MTKKVQALYDFEGQADTGEMSISTGDILTVTRTDVGEGWWEGTNANGETGLFPEAYVQEIPDDQDDSVGGAPPSMAPPPLPADYTNGGGGGGGGGSSNNNNVDDDWGNSGWNLPKQQPTSSTTMQHQEPQPQQPSLGDDPWDTTALSQPKPQQQQQPQQVHGGQQQNQAYNDDDWDSDFDDQPEAGGHPGGQQQRSTLGVPNRGAGGGSTGDISSIGRKAGPSTATGTAGTGVLGRAGLNRFSVFAKSGSENYILGKINQSVQENEVLHIVENNEGKFVWLNTAAPYGCAVAEPEKKSKMKGLKTFIAYQLTPSFNNTGVPRRYKHFDWLHERLLEKFTSIPIPPLPDKQIQGRYEEEFIEHRRLQLQSFVDRMCRHPVLSQCEVWHHFLSCTDEKKWKNGKRAAEKDPLVGGAFFMSINVPSKALDQSFVDHEISVFTTFSNQMDNAVKNMLKVTADQTSKHQGMYKREHQMVGKAFTQLGAAMQQDGNMATTNLTNAVTCTGEAYEEIGKLYEEQPHADWERLGDVMHDYRGVLGGWPNVLSVQAGAVGKRKEAEKLLSEGKMSQSEATEIANRSDVVSYAVLAEMNNFHGFKARDMKLAHQSFLQEQIKFYQNITEKLQEALRMYDSC